MLALDQALGEIVRRFGRDGIRPLLLKGPAFARWLYDEPGDRMYRDLDLLVAPESFTAARHGLEDLGFRTSDERLRVHERAPHHEVWERPGRIALVVELHRTFGLLEATPDRAWRTFSAGATTTVVGACEVSVPSPAVSALLVALHVAHHGVAVTKPQRDLARALNRVDIETWRQAAALAGELGAAVAFTAALRLSPTGSMLADDLGLVAGVGSRDFRLRMASDAAPARGLDELLRTPGLARRLARLAEELIPSREFMVRGYPAARRGPLGLVAAHATRMATLGRNLPGALRALWRAGGSTTEVMTPWQM